MNDVPLREYIEAMIDNNNVSRDALRAADSRRLDDYIAGAEKALKLREASYPTTTDFNRLKEYVDGEVGSRKFAETIRGTLATLSFIVSVGVAIWTASK